MLAADLVGRAKGVQGTLHLTLTLEKNHSLQRLISLLPLYMVTGSGGQMQCRQLQR